MYYYHGTFNHKSQSSQSQIIIISITNHNYLNHKSQSSQSQITIISITNHNHLNHKSQSSQSQSSQSQITIISITIISITNHNHLNHLNHNYLQSQSSQSQLSPITIISIQSQSSPMIFFKRPCPGLNHSPADTPYTKRCLTTNHVATASTIPHVQNIYIYLYLYCKLVQKRTNIKKKNICLRQDSNPAPRAWQPTMLPLEL